MRLRNLQLMRKRREVTGETIIPYTKFAKTSFPAAACTGYVPGILPAQRIWDHHSVPRERAVAPQDTRLKSSSSVAGSQVTGSSESSKGRRESFFGKWDSQDPWLGACHDNHSTEHLPAALQRDSCLETQQGNRKDFPNPFIFSVPVCFHVSTLFPLNLVLSGININDTCKMESKNSLVLETSCT